MCYCCLVPVALVRRFVQIDLQVVVGLGHSGSLEIEAIDPLVVRTVVEARKAAVVVEGKVEFVRWAKAQKVAGREEMVVVAVVAEIGQEVAMD